jgi:class 3 adenylate cyclase
VAGIAVSIGARVSARAAAGQVLVSQTVKDLVAGSGITFDDQGIQELKAYPGNGGCTPSQTASNDRPGHPPESAQARIMQPGVQTTRYPLG